MFIITDGEEFVQGETLEEVIKEARENLYGDDVDGWHIYEAKKIKVKTSYAIVEDKPAAKTSAKK